MEFHIVRIVLVLMMIFSHLLFFYFRCFRPLYSFFGLKKKSKDTFLGSERETVVRDTVAAAVRDDYRDDEKYEERKE